MDGDCPECGGGHVRLTGDPFVILHGNGQNYHWVNARCDACKRTSMIQTSDPVTWKMVSAKVSLGD